MRPLRSQTTPKRQPTKKWWRSYLLYAPLLWLLVWVPLSLTGPARRVEYFLLDRLIELRHKAEHRADPRLFFVGIDDATQMQFGRWPFARVFHGEFLGFLSVVHPAVVVWDILFSEDDSVNDDAFIEGIQTLGVPVVIAAARAELHAGVSADSTDFGLTQPLPVVGNASAIPGAKALLVPIAALRKVSLFGFADTLPELDGIRRKVPLVVKTGSRFYPSLTLQGLMQFWKLQPAQARVVLGDAVYLDSPQVRRRIPIDRNGDFWINYRYEQEDVPSGSYAQLHRALSARYNGQLTPDLPDLSGKLLLIALSSTGSTEIGPSPLNSRSLVPLVHINVLDNILREDYLRIGKGRFIWLIWLAVAYASLWVIKHRDFWITAAVLPTMVLITLGAMYLSFVRANLWLPLGMPMLGFVTLSVAGTGRRFLQEQLAKNRIKRAFSSYLPPAVMNHVLENPDELKLGGSRKPVTILFSDIRGFTSLSESADEETFIHQLDEYFTEMVECVNRHGGTLHKFIGDAIMAVWGDVVSGGVEKDARNALRAAIDMRRGLAKLNEKWQAESRHPFKIGIGLNHGTVLVGNVGAPQRMEFTVMGDPVNVASRIEGLTKEWHTDIAVGESITTLVSSQFFFRTLGLFRLFGKRSAVRVSAVIQEIDSSEAAPDSAPIYEQAFSDYVAGNFRNALTGFEKFLEVQPGDYCSTHYAKMCSKHLQTPSEGAWDGIHVSERK